MTPADYTAEHFQRLGYQLLARDARTRMGAIDLVAYDGHTLVFVDLDHEQPASMARRSTVRRRAVAWLRGAPGRPIGAALRFDSVRVRLHDNGQLRSLEHQEAAL